MDQMLAAVNMAVRKGIGSAPVASAQYKMMGCGRHGR